MSQLVEHASARSRAPSIEDWKTFPDAEKRSNRAVTANQLRWIYRNLDNERYRRFRRAFRKFGKSCRVCLPILEECLVEQEGEQ